MCLDFDTMMASFCNASRLQFQHFLWMVNRKVRQLRRDWWAYLDSGLDKKPGPARAQNHLCASPPPLSIMLSTGACIGKNWRHRSIENMSPLTLESFGSAQAATLQSVLVGGLFFECVVTCRRVTGHDTDSLCAVQLGLQLSENQKFDFESFTTK